MPGRSRSLCRWWGIGLVAVAIAAAGIVKLLREPKLPPPPPKLETRIPETPGKSNVILTPDRRIASVQHKSAQGLVPLEEIHTPEGIIRVQRTFSSSGELLKEEAFLNGQQVPVPRKGP